MGQHCELQIFIMYIHILIYLVLVRLKMTTSFKELLAIQIRSHILNFFKRMSQFEWYIITV